MSIEHILITFAVLLAQTFGGKYLRNRHVREVARQILESSDDPTTDIREATQRALVVAHHREVIAPTVEHLQKQQAEGKLRIAAAIKQGRKLTEGADITIVPRDGTEVFK